jgi:zinc transport system substrate-binding protein
MVGHSDRRTPAFTGVVILSLILCGVMVSGCLDLERDDEDDRIRIVVSVLPLKEFAERIGGDNVKVTVMVGEGQDPHGYEPRPSQLKDVARADLFFKVGSGLEFENVWMETLIEQNGDMEIVDGSQGIELLESGEGENGTRAGEDENDHDHEDHDPHIWTSPVNAIRMVETLRDALMNIDPENAGEYGNNSLTYVKELEVMDAELRTGLGPFPGGKFLVYHPSFGYLAHEYNLSQIAIENEGKEPTPSGIQAIIDQAKAENITTVFVSPQFDQANADVIADEIDGVVVSIDPLDAGYIANMRVIGEKLIEGFGRGGEE